ncbi:hypothetical protein ABEB36_012340, partial [Hypothenemus hampei]
DPSESRIERSEKALIIETANQGCLLDLLLMPGKLLLLIYTYRGSKHYQICCTAFVRHCI